MNRAICTALNVMALLASTGCASVSLVRPSGDNFAEVRIPEIDGRPKVLLYGVKRKLALSSAWEKGIGAELPRLLYLRPGTYSFEALCEGGPIWLHYTTKFVATVQSAKVYNFDCHPQGRIENFTLSQAEF